eukprot:13733.XXX_1098725_1098901_1 [CDS] Oithona nana genome sequencing.
MRMITRPFLFAFFLMPQIFNIDIGVLGQSSGLAQDCHSFTNFIDSQFCILKPTIRIGL